MASQKVRAQRNKSCMHAYSISDMRTATRKKRQKLQQQQQQQLVSIDAQTVYEQLYALIMSYINDRLDRNYLEEYNAAKDVVQTLFFCLFTNEEVLDDNAKKIMKKYTNTFADIKAKALTICNIEDLRDFAVEKAKEIVAERTCFCEKKHHRQRRYIFVTQKFCDGAIYRKELE